MKRIRIDRSRCIGCLTCVTACIVSHDSCDSRDRVTLSSDFTETQIFCRHCDRPECVYTCQTGAMRKDKESGFVLYDKSRCSSCYMCIMACPYGVLKSDRIYYEEIMKCDMCTQFYAKDGSQPQCVARCPMQALTLEEV
ncbi:MAG: 4Fe-4S binding protein [Clostridium sp.]|uniref:4Fe-4S dicluster domain-containing protein n=1 Tax=Clostridium sp. DSM 8431 TaxID=1761781 RepID=UPI0008E6EB44|nr:4Fe-4S dicluster domain-containing protein [Clostridium sp. DSM 8431]MCR4943515.1 4Fe-4S binding protein [Clostridium sp.]SFU57503.1 NAD(P)H-dependent nitrate reductase iron-sulfur subunit [Clostridium sp. DSM 8431]